MFGRYWYRYKICVFYVEIKLQFKLVEASRKQIRNEKEKELIVLSSVMSTQLMKQCTDQTQRCLIIQKHLLTPINAIDEPVSTNNRHISTNLSQSFQNHFLF